MSLDFYLDIPTCRACGRGPTCVFDRNATHNLVPMWVKARVRKALYESAGKKAGELVPALARGLRNMRAHPEAYRKLSAPSGWGDYVWAHDFLRSVLLGDVSVLDFEPRNARWFALPRYRAADGERHCGPMSMHESEVSASEAVRSFFGVCPDCKVSRLDFCLKTNAPHPLPEGVL